jgi:hypothetical protein
MAESCIPDVVEAIAKIVHNAMRWAADNSCTDKHPKWQGGNSFAEARARLAAKHIQALSHTTRPVEWQARNAVIEECARVADPPLMHRKGKPGLWRQRRAQIAADIRALAHSNGKLALEEGLEAAARHVEGHGGTIPGATVFAPLVSGNNMPCMSGDARDRLHPNKRREFDDATKALARAIRSLAIEEGEA